MAEPLAALTQSAACETQALPAEVPPNQLDFPILDYLSPKLLEAD
jgi:hypothetical protein